MRADSVSRLCATVEHQQYARKRGRPFPPVSDELSDPLSRREGSGVIDAGGVRGS
jgi:hypothetical protein